MKNRIDSERHEVEELLQFLYLTPVAILRLDQHGKVEMLNPKAVQLLEDLDLDSGQGDGLRLLDGLIPGLSAQWSASTGRLGPVSKPQRATVTRHDRHVLELLLNVVRPDERCTMVVIEDVTTTVEQERALQRERAKIGLVLEHIHGYCVLMLDGGGRITEWNPSVGRFFGHVEAEVVGRPLLDLVALDVHTGPADEFDFNAVELAVHRQRWCRLNAPWRDTSKAVVWGDCIITPVVEAKGEFSGYVAVIRNVTEETLRAQRLMNAALTDPLTGLSNRRGLEQRLATFFEGAQPVMSSVAVVMADIDHFKAVNDTYGHEAGDLVLKTVAEALRSTGGDSDAFARFGGEEFVAILFGVTEATAAIVAERLRSTVEHVVLTVAGQPLRVTASFGVAHMRPNEAWTEALVRADHAMYRAKRQGRNQVVCAD